MFTTLYIDFSEAQGQITLESVVVSSRNWNSSKLSCMSLLPTRMKIIHTTSSTKGNDCSPENKQVFSNSYRFFFNWSSATNSGVHGWTKF